MFAVLVRVRVKPDGEERFLSAIETDALGSERDEPGCLRFNVLKDLEEEHTYYFYEVYEDEAAFEAHKTMPHYKTWQGVADTLDGSMDVSRVEPVIPADAAYWAKS